MSGAESSFRLGALLGAEVRDREGRRLGKVRDVRLVQDGPLSGTQALLRVDALVVADGGVRLGYVRSGVKGPWLVRQLALWRERRAKVVELRGIDWELSDGVVHVHGPRTR